MFYGLTADKVKRIIRNPKRVENGVAENTIAVMVSGSNNKKPSEVWAMYQQKDVRKIIISAWRYPGISPVGKQTRALNKLSARPSTNIISALVPIPADILEELKKEGIIK